MLAVAGLGCLFRTTCGPGLKWGLLSTALEKRDARDSGKLTWRVSFWEDASICAERIRIPARDVAFHSVDAHQCRIACHRREVITGTRPEPGYEAEHFGG
jgi:hypothetical protein